MSYTDKEIEEKFNKLKESLAVQRETTKKEFEQFKNNLETKLDPKYYEKLGINIEEMTAQHWLPHLYIEPFDGDAYEEERKRAQEFFDGIAEIKETLKNEAAKEMGME